MGREVKRVPLDFDWPVEKTWAGYLISTCQSEHISCEECQHSARLRGMDFTDYGCPDFEPFVGPPKGDAWQMWETTSKGSPISPPCKSPEELARWLADNGASSFGRDTATYETWLKMIVGDAWAPSMVMEGGVLKSGVEAAS